MDKPISAGVTRRNMIRGTAAAVASALLLAAQAPTPAVSGGPAQRMMTGMLDVYVIDVGGKASLLVSPSGETMLIDAGVAGTVDRIVEVCRAAGVKKIDYMVVSHYDGDHVGGVPALAERVPIGTFVDHGPNVQQGNARYLKNVDDYMALTAKAKHVVVKAGDRIPIQGFDALVVMAAGKAIAEPLQGAGQPNPACDTTPRKVWGLDARGILDNHDTNENSQAIVFLITYGKFRMLDPADLTWNKDREMFCPMNRIGTVDLYMTANHGVENANSPVMVNALHPRVVIADNPTSHGATPEVFKIIEASPGLEDYWQMNYQPAGGEKANVPADFIGNLAGGPGGKWIKVSVELDGTFTVTNTRNNFSKTYKPRK
jgi:beta-lactamase superfamily II metal-dependent hydrolase